MPEQDEVRWCQRVVVRPRINEVWLLAGDAEKDKPEFGITMSPAEAKRLEEQLRRARKTARVGVAPVRTRRR